MNDTVEEVLQALDQFLIYRTDYKLQELVRVRNKLREDKDAEQVERSIKDFATATR